MSKILQGDAAEQLAKLETDSVDAMVTDPPAGIGFMGRSWDGDKGGRDQWIAWLCGVMTECKRVLKPGAHALVWALPRTSHWTATALEDAGFEVRDVITHIYGSGFPKAWNFDTQFDGRWCKCNVGMVEHSHDKQKHKTVRVVRNPGNKIQEPHGVQEGLLQQRMQGEAPEDPEQGGGQPLLERRGLLGATEGVPDDQDARTPESTSERLCVGASTHRRTDAGETSQKRGGGPSQESEPGRQPPGESGNSREPQKALGEVPHAGLSRCPRCGGLPEAARGFSTALKPGHENWILCRKPLDGTIAANVLEHGTGGINVDGCRVEGIPPSVPQPAFNSPTGHTYGMKTGEGRSGDMSHASGRWPSNLLLTHAARCDDAGCMPCCPVREIGVQSGINPTGSLEPHHKHKASGNHCMSGPNQERSPRASFGGDTGTAARFFPTFRYEPKPSVAERERGCTGPKRTAGELTDRKEGTAGLRNPRAGAGRTSSGRANHHPTVKSIALMQWLCRLITPPRGTVLDPFCGSGTTGIAALREGLEFVGIEINSEYAEIARSRIVGDAPLFNQGILV